MWYEPKNHKNTRIETKRKTIIHAILCASNVLFFYQCAASALMRFANGSPKDATCNDACAYKDEEKGEEYECHETKQRTTCR